MKKSDLDDSQDLLEVIRGHYPSAVRNLFRVLRARELVKLHRHLQTRLYHETTSYKAYALCPSISPNAALEPDKARM